MAWNKLYRRAFLGKHNLRFQKVKYTDDAYFTFAHMALAEKITVLKDCLCYYRVNTGNNQTAGLTNYPDSAYLPYTALKESLISWGIYGDVKQSLVNCAASFFRYFHDQIGSFGSFKYLHDKFREEIFGVMDITDKSSSYFYDERIYLWVRQIMDNTPEELLFKIARAYGNENTTAVLRFQFPYHKIHRESKIVIIGAGIMGRHFYSQAMLCGYCDVLMWAELENKFGLSYIHSYGDLRGIGFDYALIAYANAGLIDGAVAFLTENGVPKEKIIIGGTDL
jgi:hypothetical protein